MERKIYYKSCQLKEYLCNKFRLYLIISLALFEIFSIHLTAICILQNLAACQEGLWQDFNRYMIILKASAQQWD